MDKEKLIARFESIAGSNDPVGSLVAFIESHDVAEVPSMFVDAPEMFGEGDFTKAIYQAVQSQYDARAGLCPGSYESGGKTYSSKTNRGNKYIKSALAQSAINARKKRDPDLANFYYRLAGRIGTAKAVIALAHKLLRIIYVMIRDGVEYDECKLKTPWTSFLTSKAFNCSYLSLPVNPL